ncbi:MAG: hypothetical protein IIA92_02920 [Chloroflexi bacterium]|nr:hypothetical protein [Chloroflexota bacterium]
MSNSLLDRVSSMSVEDYNPTYVVQAVNALQPLGTEMALERLDSCLESRSAGEDTYGLFWVLRVLFEVPAEQGFPPVGLGRPNIPPPADPEKLPRFPIVMVREIPLLVVRGYFLLGLPEPVDAHVAYFRTHGTIREQVLHPPASMDGVEEEFLRLWQAAYGDAYAAEALGTIKAQIAKIRS